MQYYRPLFLLEIRLYFWYAFVMIDELSIIIPTLNEEKYLPRLLKSISHQKYPGKLEVVIVDGKSVDKTVEEASKFSKEFDSFHILASDKRDIGYQRNLGAKKAQFKYLLFLDADVQLSKNCLEIIYKQVVPERFVSNALHSSDERSLSNYMFLACAYGMVFFARLGRIPVTNGDFILTSKANHLKVQGFKEGSLVGEDVDYGVRSVKSGATFSFILKRLVYASARRAKKIGRAKLLFTWVTGFLHVIRKGPIYDKTKVDYGYGEF